MDTDKIDEIVSGIEEEIIKKVDAHEFPATPGMVCNSCDYKTICKFAAPVKINKK